MLPAVLVAAAAGVRLPGELAALPVPPDEHPLSTALTTAAADMPTATTLLFIMIAPVSRCSPDRAAGL